MQKNADFKNLIRIEEWQKIQNNFSALTQISMRTVDVHGLPLTQFSADPRFCSEYLPSSPLLRKKCCGCMPSFLGGSEVADKHLSYSCPFGLRNFVAVLKIDPKIPVAYVIIGPVVLVQHKKELEYKTIADECHCHLKEFHDAITEVKISSVHAMLSVVELVENVGNYLLKLSYEAVAPQTKTVGVDPDKLGRVLRVFLDVACQVSGAETGSIMLLDKAEDELSIFAAKGLENHVIKNARAKFGEGIAGTVAKERTSILIDDAIPNNRIKNYLLRPNLKSSMVLPIKVKEDVLGIINLSTTQKSSVTFTPRDLKTIDRLADLVALALHS